MSATRPASPSAVVARLRSAGCVFAADEALLLISAARTPEVLAAMVDRRAAGEPLEHVLGWAEFCGLRIAVGPGVFVPRRRTELLVRQALAFAGAPPRPAGGAPGGPGTGRPMVIVDLCCGSGAVGAALAAVLDRAEVHAADVDPVAVGYARRNLAPAGGRVYEGDLYDPLPRTLRGRIDILAANVPYVPSGEVALLPAEARVHEPRLALDGGVDGLGVLRRVTGEARHWLAPGGHLLTESSGQQAPEAAGAMARGGLLPRVVSSTERDATVVIGTRPGHGD